MHHAHYLFVLYSQATPGRVGTKGEPVRLTETHMLFFMAIVFALFFKLFLYYREEEETMEQRVIKDLMGNQEKRYEIICDL